MAIYVKNNIAFEEIYLSTVNVKLEVCAIKLHLEKKTITLYNIYDSHFGRADNIEEYNLLFSKIKTEYSIIVGDLTHIIHSGTAN